jgi:hypothetical protein
MPSADICSSSTARRCVWAQSLDRTSYRRRARRLCKPLAGGADSSEKSTLCLHIPERRARFDDTLTRADDLLRERLRREEQELARQDASLEEGLAGLAAPECAPTPKREDKFRRQTPMRSHHSAANLQRLPTGHDLADVRADDVASQEVVFSNFEALLLQAARQEGEKPSAENLPPDGTLVSRTRVDDMNGKSINWYGTESFIKGFTRPGRQVERIVDRSTGQAIWGKPF